jgi:hypothetical protein
MNDECAKLNGMVPNSGRNNALNASAFSLGQLVASGELERSLVEHRLLEAAAANGLVAEDGIESVRATIRSGLNAGMRSPRNRHGRFA